MAQTQLSDDLLNQIGAQRGRLGQIWFFVRRWPIIPLFLLVLLVFTGIFADILAPHDPIIARPDNRNIPPVWEDPLVLNIKETGDPLAFPLAVEKGIEEAMVMYGVVPTLENTANQEAVEAAFKEKGYIAKVKWSSWDHILGGDNIGRDLLSRIIHGARVSLVVVAIAVTSGLLLGVSMGLVAGYFGGFIDAGE